MPDKEASAATGTAADQAKVTSEDAAVVAQTGTLGTISPLFRLVFFTVTGLTILLFGLDLVLVLAVSNPTPEAAKLMDTCAGLATAGFGAIIGLLGGKAI